MASAITGIPLHVPVHRVIHVHPCVCDKCPQKVKLMPHYWSYGFVVQSML